MSKSVITALVVNAIIATAKGIAAVVTGSASMLAEAIHSSADCGNQALVMVGQRQAKQGNSESHPFGRGKANFFWSLIVAVVLFSLGGLFSIYEGFHKILNPEPLEHVYLILSIIAMSIIFEGYALKTSLDESQTKLSKILHTIRNSSSTDLLVVLVEDTGALIGLSVLTLGMLLSIFVHPIFDGIAAITIGVLLITLSVVLLIELNKLIIGESLPRHELVRIKQLIKENSNTLYHLNFVKSMFIGSNQVFLLISIDVKDDSTGYDIEQDTRQLKHILESEFPQYKLMTAIEVYEF